jgi:hypothetical protein
LDFPRQGQIILFFDSVIGDFYFTTNNILADKVTMSCVDCRGYVIGCLHLINAIFKLAVNKTQEKKSIHILK